MLISRHNIRLSWLSSGKLSVRYPFGAAPCFAALQKAGEAKKNNKKH